MDMEMDIEKLIDMGNVAVEGTRTNLDFALDYAKRGWRVLPLHYPIGDMCSCGNPKCERNKGKHPLTLNGDKDATTDEGQIRAWWTKNPQANIGIAIRNFCVFDWDPRNGGDKSYQRLIALYGPLPLTVGSTTGGGGGHELFQPDVDFGLPDAEGDWEGIDIKRNGYIVAPGSLHKSGKRYAWCDGRSPDEVAIAPLPSFLKQPKKPVVVETDQPGNSMEHLTLLSGAEELDGESIDFKRNSDGTHQIVVNGESTSAWVDNNGYIGSYSKGGPTALQWIQWYKYDLPQAREIAKKYGINLKASAETCSILSDDKVSSLEARIKSIPVDTAPTKIPAILDPILKEIAGINIAQGDALLRYTIKDHFKYTVGDLRGYEQVLKKYRKEPRENETKQALSQGDLIEMLKNDQGSVTIHPAQDYGDGVMVFSVKVQDKLCLVTSDKRLFGIEDAVKEGFVTKHSTVDTTRFSSDGVIAYLGDKYDVNPRGLYEKIYNYIKRFIYFRDDEYLSYLTLWVMGTYVFMVFRYFPYVWVNAEKQSGKTLLMEILSDIAFNGSLFTNPTEAVIFRDISNNLVAMFIDEVENLRQKDKDVYGSVISILNVGFNKAGVVKRAESTGQGGFAVKAYSAYSPKMFSGINKIDDVLQDRTIRIPILRKKENEVVDRYKSMPEILDLQRSIRDDLYIFALTNAKTLAENYYKPSEVMAKGLEHLSNRELDIWEPIFLLANLVGGQSDDMNLTGQMKTLSQKSLQEKQLDGVEQNMTYKVLTVLKSMLNDVPVFDEVGDVRSYDAGKVLGYFNNNDAFEFISSTNKLTSMLRPFGVVSGQKRVGSGDDNRERVYTINIKDIYDQCERYKI